MHKTTANRWIRSADDTRKLMEVALGRRSADLAVVGAALLNVYTGEVLENQSVCIWDRWIARVSDDPGDCIGSGTEVIEAAGRTVIPGLIDGHMHMAWLCTPESFLLHAMSGGTTTIVTEILEPYPVAGLPGIEDFLESIRDQPIKIFATAPIMVSTSEAARGISQQDLEALLARDDILGLGESYWQAILQEPGRYLPALSSTLIAGKTLEGHSAGAGGKNLDAYVAAGISSCHEPIQAREVLDRLRLGIHVMIREGSIRRDLDKIAPIRDTGADLRRLVLVSDGIEPGDLMELGYMEYIVQKAVDCGFDPVTAVQMATLNVAEHFRLDHLIGGIAPGRFADLVLVPDLRTLHADLVVSNGKVIARDGKPLASPRPHTFSEASLHTVRLEAHMTPDDFVLRAPQGQSKVTVRAIDMVTDLVTREARIEMPVRDGKILADPGDGLLKVAAVDRTNFPGKRFVGVIRGFGMKSGALASSASWDTTDIVVVGASDADIALAVNRVVALQGGAVVCDHGEVLEEIALPVFGIMSLLPLEEVHQKTKAFSGAAAELGVPFRDPLLSLITLTGAAIPFLRVCEEGLVELKTGKTLGLRP